MIKEQCFTEEWLNRFKKRKEHKRIDKNILEKMIYALHLAEQLKANGLEFVFKGGTSLVLLLGENNRFSIDIDIITITDRDKLDSILQTVIESSRFNDFRLDEDRSFPTGVPKAHYKFYFDSERTGSGTILLDVLIGDPLYPELIELPTQAKWIETEEETRINVPSVDAITGDKLTAFAPNTTGIPYAKGKDQQPFAMEICKQLFDLGRLFEHIVNLEIVADSFHAFAQQEIEYRRQDNSDHVITPKNVLQDTIGTCLIIAKRGHGSEDEIAKFTELQNGIKALDSGYLMSGHFRIDDAIPAAGRVAYLATKILANDLSPIAFYQRQEIQNLNIEEKGWKFLNRLNRLPDKTGFYYWYQAVQILKTLEI
jgi:hypothetical protein